MVLGFCICQKASKWPSVSDKREFEGGMGEKDGAEGLKLGDNRRCQVRTTRERVCRVVIPETTKLVLISKLFSVFHEDNGAVATGDGAIRLRNRKAIFIT